MKRISFNPRKVLIASAGLATLNYVAASGCAKKPGDYSYAVANLMPAPPCDASVITEYCRAPLVEAPDFSRDASTDANVDPPIDAAAEIEADPANGS